MGLEKKRSTLEGNKKEPVETEMHQRYYYSLFFTCDLYFHNLNDSEWLVKFDDKVEEEENTDYLENRRCVQKDKL